MAFDYEGKIANLLNKAEDEAATPEEAEAATAMAERLMVKYSITRAQAASRMAQKEDLEEIVSVEIRFKGEYRDSYVAMGNCVVNALGDLRCYTHGGDANSFRRVGKPLFIVGFQSDVDQAKTLIESLQLQSATAMGTWWKVNKVMYSTQSQKLRARREFVSSFGYGAGERIRKARASAMDEAEREAPGTALAVRNRSDQVDAHIAGLGLSHGRASRRKGDGSARMAGTAAGRNANTGDRPIGGIRTAIGR